jgi:hypothetical protein
MRSYHARIWCGSIFKSDVDLDDGEMKVGTEDEIMYIFVCYDVFTKYVKLCPLRSATTRACLNKLLNYYFVDVKTIYNTFGQW